MFDDNDYYDLENTGQDDNGASYELSSDELADDSPNDSPWDDEPPDNSDEEVYLQEYTGNSSLGKKKPKKKSKRKHKKKSKGSATSTSINGLIDRYAYDPDDPDDCPESDVEPVAKSRARQPSLTEMANELCQKVEIKNINGQVYFYNNLFYEPLDAESTIALYREHVQPDLDGAKNLRNHMDIYKCLKADRSLVYTEPLNNKPYCPLKNGIFYLDKMKLKSYKPKRITFICLDACYDEDAECPNFDKFLDVVTDGNEVWKERIMMAIGYLLIEPANGKFFLVAGYARNSGKSVLGNFIQRLYPRDAVSNLSLSELGGKFETESLLSSRINISLDLPDEVLNASAVSKLKRITGGDWVEIQQKNQKSLKLDHNLKFLFASNFKLKIASMDEAFWDRVVLLPFVNSIPPEEQDPDLAQKLWEERDAIVTKALRYARDLMDNGWHFPEIEEVDKMKGAVQLKPEDNCRKFLTTHCELGEPTEFCYTEELKREYMNYCIEKHIVPCNDMAFNRCVEEFGGIRTRKRPSAQENSKYGFYGIRLLP